MHQDYYVYKLLDPSKGNSPFYVGKGRKSRVKNHYCASYMKMKNHKSYTIAAYRALGYSDVYEIVESNLTEDQAYNTEITLIAEIGCRHNGTGPLVNYSAGGEGGPGIMLPKTEDHRRKISEAKKGQSLSKEHRLALSKAKKGRPCTDSHKAQISRTMKGRPKSEEHKRKLREAKLRRDAQKKSGGITPSTGVYGSSSSSLYSNQNDGNHPN